MTFSGRVITLFFVAGFVICFAADPTTITTPSTTTKAAQSTTTNATTTTTPKPTPPPTTTTTPTPSTTVPPVPTTPVYPPSPNASQYFNLTEGNNTCLLASFAATFRFTYEDIYNRTVTVGINVPQDAEVDKNNSKCNSTGLLILVLNFNDGNNSLSLRFNASESDAWLQRVDLQYLFNNETFPNYPHAPKNGKLR